MSKRAPRLPLILLSATLSLGTVLTGWAQSATPAQPAAATASALPSGWTQFDLHGFKVQTPFALQKVPMPPLNAQVLKAIAFMEAYQGATPQMVIMTNVTEYQPGTVGDLDGAVKGAIGGMARAINQPAPEYTARELTISGHPARDVTATFTMSDPATGQPRTITCRIILVLAGVRLGQVVIMPLSGDPAPTITKIIDSISIAAE